MTRITSDTGLLLALVTNVIGDLMRDPFTMIGCVAPCSFWIGVLADHSVSFSIMPLHLCFRKADTSTKIGARTNSGYALPRKRA